MSNDIDIIEPGDLSRLPALIDAAVADVQAHAGGMVQAAERAGSLLLDAKCKVMHGNWQTWLTANCAIAPRTAQAYMRLSEKLKAMPHEMRSGVALLPLREAMKAIATPAMQPPRRPSIIPLQREQRTRAEVILKRSSDALKALTRQVSVSYAKRLTIERTRKTLQAALLALDTLEVHPDVVEGVRHD